MESFAMLIAIFGIIATINGVLGVLSSIRRVYFKDDEKD